MKIYILRFFCINVLLVFTIFACSSDIKDVHSYEKPESISVPVMVTARAQVGDQVWENLHYFQSASAFQDGNLNEALKPAIDYTFMIYQLGTLGIKHSDEFNNIQNRLLDILDRNGLGNDQCQNILNSLRDTIPDAPEGNFFVETQLKL